MPKDIEIRDFSKRRYFPGTRGNPFDVFLHRYNNLESVSGILFAFFLFGLATLVTWAVWPKTAMMFGFFLGDWLLLYLLPKFQKSFGPAKPPTLALVILRSLVAWTPLEINLPLQILGTLLVIYGFWIEPHKIQLSRQQLSTSKIKPGKSIRLLQLSDLHIERITGREKQILDWIDQLQPDMILFAGDVLSLSNQNDPTAIEQARQLLSSLKAPYGVYTVAGSPAVDLPELLPKIYQDLPVHFLENQQVDLDIHGAEIHLTGIQCTHRPFIDANYLPKLDDKNNHKLQILLYHSPDLAPHAARAGIDLQLSGHTHGGQVRLPVIGALFTGSLHGKSFYGGRITLGDMTLFVTRGLGMEGLGAPRVRFLCPPEIVLWEISSSQST